MADESPGVAASVAAEAPQAQSPAPTLGEMHARAKAAALGSEAPAQQGAAVVPDAPTEDADPWEPKLPQVKPQNMRERLAAAQAKREAAQQNSTLQSQLEQLQSRFSEATSAEQNAMAKFQEHLNRGEIDEAFKVKGLPVSFEDIQRAKLKAMGAISDAPRDPRVDAMEKELRAFKEAEQKRQEAYRQHQERQAAAREEQEALQQVQVEIEALPLPGAKELTQVAGFKEAVLQLMMHNPNATIEQCAAVARRDYLAYFDQLNKAFGSGGQRTMGAAPTQQAPQQRQSPAQAIAARRTAAAAPAPLGALSPNMSLKERQAAAKARALRG